MTNATNINKKNANATIPPEAWNFLRQAQLDCDIHKMLHPQVIGRIDFEEVDRKPEPEKAKAERN